MAAILTAEGKTLTLDYIGDYFDKVFLYGKKIVSGDEQFWDNFSYDDPSNITWTVTGNELSAEQITITVSVGGQVSQIIAEGVILISSQFSSDNIGGSLGYQTIAPQISIPFVDGGGDPISFTYDGSGNFTVTELTITL